MSDRSRNTNPQLPSSDGNSLSSQSDRSDQPDQSGRPVAEPQASGPAKAGALSFDEIKAACLNLGINLNCGGCASAFFTGYGGDPHDEHCTQTSRPAETETALRLANQLMDEIEGDARSQGFRDCEELVIGFLQREADKGRACTAEFALRSAALAIRLGQYKDAEDVEP